MDDNYVYIWRVGITMKDAPANEECRDYFYVLAGDVVEVNRIAKQIYNTATDFDIDRECFVFNIEYIGYAYADVGSNNDGKPPLILRQNLIHRNSLVGT